MHNRVEAGSTVIPIGIPGIGDPGEDEPEKSDQIGKRYAHAEEVEERSGHALRSITLASLSLAWRA